MKLWLALSKFITNGANMYSIVYSIVWVPCWLLFRVLLRWQVTGLENIPSGGAIIAPNHQSFWDIPLLGVALKGRHAHFMAKSELFQNPIFSWVIRTLLAFPVKRGAPDRAAIRHAIEMLKQGDLVTIFPEGTRSKTGQLGAPEAGLSLIAAKADVPIVPVAIYGTRYIFSRSCFLPQIKIHFAKPINMFELKATEGETRTDVGIVVMQSIADILQQKFK
jgi:1-acyl-sn-glycerol-3-phosphate acyltransferase